MNQNQYWVTISFVVNAKSNEAAEYKAKYIASRQNLKNNDRCYVESIQEINENSLTTIYLKENNGNNR